MQPKIVDSSPSAAARTTRTTLTSRRSSWDENEIEESASGRDSLLTSSTASLQPPQDNARRWGPGLGPGPGLLIFPGTAQRHQHNPNGSKTIAKANDENVAINQQGPTSRSIRSFRRPPLWQPPQDRGKAEQGKEDEEVLDRQNPRDSRGACLAKVQAFIIEFLQGSSIHGFIYLAKLGLNFVER